MAASTPSKRKSATTKSSSRASSRTTSDAIKLLVQDHKQVKALFKEYDKLVQASGSDEEKQGTALEICAMLTAHASAEEELFYPAARRALGEDADLIDEADVEHASTKALVAQIEASTPATDDHYDARVKVLGEYIDHHVKEEEGEIFPKVKKADLDLKALGKEILVRKDELRAELGMTA